jgi:hypothetical protein
MALSVILFSPIILLNVNTVLSTCSAEDTFKRLSLMRDASPQMRGQESATQLG